MTQVLVTEGYLGDIADAIRAKGNTESALRPDQMAGAIAALPSGGTLGTKSIAANGTYNASSDSLDGYSSVTVNVPNSYAAADEGKVVSNGALVAQTARASEITENGTYDTTTNDEVTVNVSGGSATLITKSITQNGTYAASSDNADGYSSVSVNVSGGGEDPFALTDYIESSGTQWIDTGYVPIDTSRLEAVAEIGTQSNSDTYATVLGIRNNTSATNGNMVWVYAKYNGTYALGFVWDSSDRTNIATSSSVYVGSKVEIVVSRGNAYAKTLNGTIVGGVQGVSSYTKTYSLGLFNLKSAGTIGSATACKMKLYRFRIYESDTLVHDFVPWKDGSDVVCLKDTVTGDLKYNAGTGTFTFGTDS